MTRSGADLLRVWTIQPLAVYEALRETGELPADPSRGPFARDTEMLARYAWMRAQMRRRVLGYGGGPLWWAYTWRPDLRAVRHTRLYGGYVRLELGLPRSQALLSSYGAWDCCVLGGTGAPLDDAEWEESHAWSRDQAEATWPRIFDAGACADLWGGLDQAVFERLRLRDVRRATPFTGAYKLRFFDPSALDPDELPPLTGYGDDVRIGDRVRVTYHSGGRAIAGGVRTVRGYEPFGRGAFIVHYLSDKSHPGEFATNGVGWRREFRRVE